MLEIRELSVWYGSVQVLNNVNLTVPPGQFVGLLGANGAGKTTLLKSISRLVMPQHGTIQFEGHNLLNLPPHHVPRLGIAHVPEGRHVFPNLTVRDNLLLGCYSLKLRSHERKQKLDEIYAVFPRLYERKTQLAGSLSGGEQQMLVIGRALMLNPRLLILDEPSLGLAPIVVDEVFEKLAQVQREKDLALLMIEQNAIQSLDVIDSAVLIEHGRITFSGTAAELKDTDFIKQAYLGA